MDLPTELRQIIIQHTLQGHRKSPPTPSKSNGILVEDFSPVAQRWQLGSCSVYYERQDQHCPTNCLPLLLTSRQISTETKSVLDYMKIDYDLDISVLNDVDLFPTWISVPCLTQRINHLRAEVRLFGHVISSATARCHSGDGGHLGIDFAFHQVLQRFLMYGPVGEKKGQSNDGFENKSISVRVLELNFTSAEKEYPYPPDHIHWRDFLSQRRGHGKLDREVKIVNGVERSIIVPPKYKTRPQWMARWVGNWIDAILGRDSYGKMYGKMIYENVGTLRFLADGTLIKEFDLSDCSEDVVARREELGFPLLKPEPLPKQP